MSVEIAPALMYHDVVPAGAEDSSGFPGRDAALYKITPQLFDTHLAAMMGRVGRAGLHDSCHRHGLHDARGLPRPRAPLISFDDGGISAMAAADLLERRGLSGCFFVTVNCLGSRRFLSVPQLRDLRRRGHLVGSHSCSHPLRMGHCAPGRVLEEWTRSRAVLADALGEEPADASLPGGDFAPLVAEAAAMAGFTRLFTSEPVLVPRCAYGLILHGRFTIRRWTSARTAAALAAGDWTACTRQAAAWTLRKIGKHLGGRRYLELRRLLLRHGNELRWGDQR